MGKVAVTHMPCTARMHATYATHATHCTHDDMIVRRAIFSSSSARGFQPVHILALAEALARLVPASLAALEAARKKATEALQAAEGAETPVSAGGAAGGGPAGSRDQQAQQAEGGGEVDALRLVAARRQLELEVYNAEAEITGIQVGGGMRGGRICVCTSCWRLITWRSRGLCACVCAWHMQVVRICACKSFGQRTDSQSRDSPVASIQTCDSGAQKACKSAAVLP